MEQTNRHNSGRKQHQTRVYKVGALVRFVCLPGHQLLGEASIICTENGTWSHPSPVCKFSILFVIILNYVNLFFFLLLITFRRLGKVRCPYPGDPPHGRIAPLKFWYKPGDNIQVREKKRRKMKPFLLFLFYSYFPFYFISVNRNKYLINVINDKMKPINKQFS